MDHLLHVGTKEPLLNLVRHERVAREPVDGLYLYCAMSPVLRERQLLARHVLQAEPNLTNSLAGTEVVPNELKAAMVLFFSMLDEKQRRLCAERESLNSAMAGISGLPSSWAWTLTRWPRAGANYSNRIWP